MKPKISKSEEKANEKKAEKKAKVLEGVAVGLMGLVKDLTKFAEGEVKELQKRQKARKDSK